MPNYLPATLSGCLAFTMFVAGALAQQRSFYQQTDYKGQEIGKLTGDVYYARMDDYVSVFMVTPDGHHAGRADRHGICHVAQRGAEHAASIFPSSM